MAKTLSETYFEKFCDNCRITYERIQEEIYKTPDYYLTIDGKKIIVEVKEILQNKAEQEEIQLAGESKGYLFCCIPGDQVRKKIKKSSAQIKKRTKGIYPSLLVLFDRSLSDIHMFLDHIRVAMYGLEQVRVDLPIIPLDRPRITGMSYGKKRKMTEEHNTSISAIGVLYIPRPNEILLDVYHNKFAAVPISPLLLAKYGITQFALEDEVPGKTAKWKKISAHNQP